MAKGVGASKSGGNKSISSNKTVSQAKPTNTAKISVSSAKASHKSAIRVASQLKQQSGSARKLRTTISGKHAKLTGSQKLNNAQHTRKIALQRAEGRLRRQGNRHVIKGGVRSKNTHLIAYNKDVNGAISELSAAIVRGGRGTQPKVGSFRGRGRMSDLRSELDHLSTHGKPLQAKVSSDLLKVMDKQRAQIKQFGYSVNTAKGKNSVRLYPIGKRGRIGNPYAKIDTSSKQLIGTKAEARTRKVLRDQYKYSRVKQGQYNGLHGIDIIAGSNPYMKNPKYLVVGVKGGQARMPSHKSKSFTEQNQQTYVIKGLNNLVNSPKASASKKQLGREILQTMKTNPSRVQITGATINLSDKKNGVRFYPRTPVSLE